MADDPFSGADRTIFTSPQSMDSDERAAVKSGEARGKKVAMAERSEHYGCIGSINHRQNTKNTACAIGVCETENCEHYDPDAEKVGEHCKLPKSENCVK